MKTYKNIFPRICAYDNLYFAWRDAARGKRKSPEVAAFEYALTDNLLRLEAELREGRYRPRPYRHFHITYPKPRRISAARFRDRVVHHALVRQIEPIFEARFIHDSYACRLGRGTHAALDRCRAFARRYRYVLQCDIVQFFPAVDHGILRDILFRLIVDERARWLGQKPSPITITEFENQNRLGGDNGRTSHQWRRIRCPRHSSPGHHHRCPEKLHRHL